jgi:uncharacterized protein
MNSNVHSEYPTRTSVVFSRLAEIVFKIRWLLIFLVTGLTIFAFSQMQNLRFDNSNEVWFVKGDQSLELLDKFRNVFGNDDFVVLLFEFENFFELANIKLMGNLANALEDEVPYLKDMTWLGNVESIEGTETGITISEFLEIIPETADTMVEMRNKALREPTYLNRLISADGQVATIILEMERYPEDGDTLDPKNEIAPVIREILARPEFNALTSHVVGGPILHHDYDKLAARETSLFMGLCLLIQMTVLLWVGRGFRAVLVPIIIVFLSIIWTLGAISLIGFTLNMMIVLLPPLLICVGIGDSMHFIAEYQDHCDAGNSRKKSMVKTFAIVGLPCLLTTLTTMSAFLSFLTVRINPFRELGIYAAVGVMSALILTYILVMFFYSFHMEKDEQKGKSIKQKKRLDIFDKLLEKITRIVTARPGWIVSFFVILGLVSILGALNVKIESNTARLLTKKVPIRQAYDFIDERMGGSMSMEIMLDTGKTDGIKNPEFLHKMNELQDFANSHPLVTKATSVLDVLKKMRRAMHNNKPEFYTIPDTREAISQYLFMYETSGGDQLDKLIGFDYDIARMTVKTKTLNTADVSRFMKDLEFFTAKTFDNSVTVELTGAMSWVKALNDKMGEGIKSSFTVVLLVIGVLMMIFLRSIKLGLISIIPNVFPVIVTLGAMGFAGIHLDMGLMSCSAVIIGVAVDDTIHFFRRYRLEFNILGNYSYALKATLTTVGRPIIFTTITLVLGFGVMLLSNMTGWRNFGFFAGFAFLWALLADFFFAPALMLLLKPLGPEHVK